MNIEPIAFFKSPFASKFGIPKQSGLVQELRGTIVFAPQYRNADALRGLDEFDYVWLIWEFSANRHAATSPVVRPPLLGGNVRMGVFATRSPFRPNPLGLSCVRLERIEYETMQEPVIHVLGADLMDGTPIYDIKPYIAYADAHPNARCGFVDTNVRHVLNVNIPHSIAAQYDADELEALRHVLALDPRPQYHTDATKTYGMLFAGRDVHFKVSGDTLEVVE